MSTGGWSVWESRHTIPFRGPRTPLTGPTGVVQSLVRHDDHLHVRLPAR
jgi:hypothetical protein